MEALAPAVMAADLLASAAVLAPAQELAVTPALLARAQDGNCLASFGGGV